MTLSPDQRHAGLLVPLFALRGRRDLGIGDVAALRELIAWTANLGFRLIQLLPINETGSDHSPYNAISSRAIDPTTIETTPEALADLSESDFRTVLEQARGDHDSAESVSYPAVKRLKLRLLEKAFSRFEQRPPEDQQALAAFIEQQTEWIESYSLFRSLVEYHGMANWNSWPDLHRSPQGAENWVASLPPQAEKTIRRRRRLFCYIQWVAFEQWRQLKEEAGHQGIALMGDIPFGISYQSADVWSHPDLFQTAWFGGTPPDKIFKHDPFVQKWGQNWGLPLYQWSAHRAENFRWWRARVGGVREFFDLFRIDHILGFYRIYGFPWPPERNGEFLPLDLQEARKRTHGRLPGFQPRPDDTPAHREHNCRDGETYLRPLLEEAGPDRIVGEDLGEVPDYVRPSLHRLDIAGMKVPIWEREETGELIPGIRYERRSLAIFGTHDHDPLRVHWERLAADAATPGGTSARDEMRRLATFAGLRSSHPPASYTPALHRALLDALFRSNSWLAVVMITDLFARTERFNLPGIAAGNWTRRMHAPVSQLDLSLILPGLPQMLSAAGR